MPDVCVFNSVWIRDYNRGSLLLDIVTYSIFIRVIFRTFYFRRFMLMLLVFFFTCVRWFGRSGARLLTASASHSRYF